MGIVLNFLFQKNGFEYCADPKNFVPEQKAMSIRFSFCAGITIFSSALNIMQFFVWPKKTGLAQNILGHVKGQGIVFDVK